MPNGVKPCTVCARSVSLSTIRAAAACQATAKGEKLRIVKVRFTAGLSDAAVSAVAASRAISEMEAPALFSAWGSMAASTTSAARASPSSAKCTRARVSGSASAARAPAGSSIATCTSPAGSTGSPSSVNPISSARKPSYSPTSCRALSSRARVSASVSMPVSSRAPAGSTPSAACTVTLAPFSITWLASNAAADSAVAGASGTGVCTGASSSSDSGAGSAVASAVGAGVGVGCSAASGVGVGSASTAAGSPEAASSAGSCAARSYDADSGVAMPGRSVANAVAARLHAMPTASSALSTRFFIC